MITDSIRKLASVFVLTAILNFVSLIVLMSYDKSIVNHAINLCAPLQPTAGIQVDND